MNQQGEKRYMHATRRKKVCMYAPEHRSQSNGWELNDDIIKDNNKNIE